MNTKNTINKLILSIVSASMILPLLQTFALAQSVTDKKTILPVSTAKDGFTPAQATDLLKRFNNIEGFKAEDVSLFGFLNFGELLPTTTISRMGNVVMLEKAVDPKIGQVKFTGDYGEMTLDQYLADPRSRAQGIVVVHKGKIVYEQYPGMREFDNHVWMSTTKTLASHMVAVLEEQGKINVQKPVEFYIPQLKNTAWEGTKVIDILDMTTGMDVAENDKTRVDPNSAITRMNLAGSGKPNAEGKVETMMEVFQSAKRINPPGEIFDYSSLITLILPMLVESVENRRWADVFQEQVWSKMTVEGDLQMGMTPEGLALAHGLAMGRLRDLARWGMLYTPSWNKAAREKLVSDAYLAKIQKEGRPEIYLKGEFGQRMAKAFGGDIPVSNSYQWDAVFADGDFYKSGVRGQGLYVSPNKDVVVVFTSTVLHSDLPGYARAIAKTFSSVK